MSLGAWGGAIKALMLETSQAHVVADDIEQAYHLAEDQDPAQCGII